MSEPGRGEWQAFGTTAVLCTTRSESFEAARAAVERTLDAVNAACNRFGPASELARVNALSGRRVRISSLLTTFVSAALDAAATTEGAVDPTVGTSLEAAGYDRDYRAIRPSARAPRFRPALGWRSVELSTDDGTLRVPRGVKLDLGSTGKALAVDMAAAAAAEAAACGVLFSLGGDMRIAGEPPHGGWPVHVTDDHAAGARAPGQTLTITEGALATSSTLVRRWRRAEQLHHILDPATGRPAREIWCTASVAATSCVEANAHATAALVRGHDAAGRLTAFRLPARLRARSGSIEYIGGWPADGDTPCGPGI